MLARAPIKSCFYQLSRLFPILKLFKGTVLLVYPLGETQNQGEAPNFIASNGDFMLPTAELLRGQALLFPPISPEWMDCFRFWEIRRLGV